MSLDGMYYYDKEEYIRFLTEGFGCGVETEYSTAMDGVEGWSSTAWHCWSPWVPILLGQDNLAVYGGIFKEINHHS